MIVAPGAIPTIAWETSFRCIDASELAGKKCSLPALGPSHNGKNVPSLRRIDGPCRPYQVEDVPRCFLADQVMMKPTLVPRPA